VAGAELAGAACMLGGWALPGAGGAAAAGLGVVVGAGAGCEGGWALDEPGALAGDVAGTEAGVVALEPIPLLVFFRTAIAMPTPAARTSRGTRTRRRVFGCLGMRAG